MPFNSGNIHVIAISGSLRKGSYNTAALQAAREAQPAGMEIEIADISKIPVFNEDTEAEGLPPAVAGLRRRVTDADALLIATPEYNYSLPGVLKNTIDWLSRTDRAAPRAKSPLNGKALGIMGVSTGHFGTARAQLHLRQICTYTNMLPLNKPEVLIFGARDKFDSQGTLTDTATRGFVKELLDELLVWTRQISPANSLPARERAT